MSNDKALVPVEERLVEFYGDDLVAVRIRDNDGELQVYVPIRPISEYLGLNWSGQQQRIRRDPVMSEEARIVCITHTNPQGGNPNMLCLPLEFIPGWLFGISVNRVRAELQDKIKQYQRECFNVLWQAFQAGHLTTDVDVLQGDSPAVQAFQLAMAVANLARNQVLMEAQLTGRLDGFEKRLETIEAQFGDETRTVSEDQASQISQAVKAIALEMGKRSGRNEYGGVYGEFYRKFGITSYKLLPASQFGKAMSFLTDWHQSLTGDSPF